MDIGSINRKKIQNSWTSGESCKTPALIGLARMSMPSKHILVSRVKASSKLSAHQTKRQNSCSGVLFGHTFAEHSANS